MRLFLAHSVHFHVLILIVCASKVLDRVAHIGLLLVHVELRLLGLRELILLLCVVLLTLILQEPLLQHGGGEAGLSLRHLEYVLRVSRGTKVPRVH